MPKIFVSMDMVRVFWPVIPESGPDAGHPTLEVPQILIDEYGAAIAAMQVVNDKFEQLYRVQEKLSPWVSPPVPDHILLES